MGTNLSLSLSQPPRQNNTAANSTETITLLIFSPPYLVYNGCHIAKSNFLEGFSTGRSNGKMMNGASEEMGRSKRDL
jgi:hypothetical protein